MTVAADCVFGGFIDCVGVDGSACARPQTRGGVFPPRAACFSKDSLGNKRRLRKKEQQPLGPSLGRSAVGEKTGC